MKILIFILIVLISFYYNLNADCSSSRFIYLKTTNSLVTKNSLFIVESYFDQLILRNLGKVYNTYLKSENDSVKLDVIKYNKSKSALSQVLLKPQRELIADEEYQLFIDTNNAKILLNKNKTKFKIQNTVENEKPKIEKCAKYLYKYSIYYGCGPENYVVFGVCIKDYSKLFAITKIKNLETGLIQEYILPILEHTISIGRDMCSGEFYLEENRKYEVSFTYMDLSGNKTLDKNKYCFTAPNDSDDIYKLEKKLFTKDNDSKDEISLFIGYHYITNYYVEIFCKCGKYNIEPDFIFVSKSHYIKEKIRGENIHQNITLIVISFLIVILILLFKYI